MNLSSLLRYIAIGFLSGVILFSIVAPSVTRADEKNDSAPLRQDTLVHNGKLTLCKLDPTHYEVVKIKKVIVTAYSSSWDETTGIPGKPGLITASGRRVADGVVAYNHLPFGTKVRINVPGLEDKIFVVEDRTAAGRKNLDIWMPSKQEAKQFGARYNVKIEILES